MPLLTDILSTNLQKLLNQEYPSFEGFPDNMGGVVESWANAINDYAKSVVPTSTTSEQAKEAFKSTMLGMSSELGNGAVILPLAFTNYATALALGMAGAGFIGTPPVAPINLAPIIAAGLGGASGEIIANSFTVVVDIWFRTGTATPTAGGSPIIWT